MSVGGRDHDRTAALSDVDLIEPLAGALEKASREAGLDFDLEKGGHSRLQ